MTYEEAVQWLLGNRSLANLIPSGDMYIVHLAQADAAMMQAAYYIVKYHHEFGGKS